jgi:hypothetical protein
MNPAIHSAVLGTEASENFLPRTRLVPLLNAQVKYFLPIGFFNEGTITLDPRT